MHLHCQGSHRPVSFFVYAYNLFSCFGGIPSKEISELCGTVEIDGKEKNVLSVTQLQRLKIGWENSQVLVLRGTAAPYLSWVKDFAVYPQAKYNTLPFEKNDLSPVKSFSVVRYMYTKLSEELKNGKEKG